MTEEHNQPKNNPPPKTNGNGTVHVEPIITSSDEAERNRRRVSEWNKSHVPVIRSGCKKGS